MLAWLSVTVTVEEGCSPEIHIGYLQANDVARILASARQIWLH